MTQLSSVKFHLVQRKNERHYFAITGPNRLTLHLYFHSPVVNSIQRTVLRVTIFRGKDDWDENSEIQILEKYELKPGFDKQMKIFWRDSELTFAIGTALLDFAFDKFVSALSADR